MICPLCCGVLQEDKENEKKGEEQMYWFCRNCGIEVKIWSRRK